MFTESSGSAHIPRSATGVIEMTWLPMQMPLGQEYFKVLREGGKYYVDKTGLIKDIEEYGDGTVLLYTRPRRFGKTLNMSMLDSYFNQKYKGNTWFDGLRISDLKPDDPEKNSNVVISLTLKDLESSKLEGVVHFVQENVANQLVDIIRHDDSLRMDPRFRAMYDDIVARGASKEVVKTSLRDACKLIFECYGKNTILLIDEYDNAMNKLYGTSVHREVVEFMSGFFSSALKTNPYLKFAVLTGVMRISKESIFSGMNNLVVNDVLSDDECSDERFGFTSEEVRKICEDLGAPEKFDDVKLWYDGYRFNGREIYNPWSVMACAQKRFATKTYWANTSSNDILDDLLKRADDDQFKAIEALCSGKRLRIDLDESISYKDLDYSAKDLYSIMVMTGYLTAIPSDDKYEVFFPNTEISKVFGRKMSSCLTEGKNTELSFLNEAVKTGDVDTVAKALTKLLEVLSVRMLRSEYAYQAYLAGLFVASREDHTVTTDREAGDGYYDIMLTSTKRSGVDVLMELKRCKKTESPGGIAEKALDQIIGKRYNAATDRTVMAYGVAFKSKKATVTFRRIEPER